MPADMLTMRDHAAKPLASVSYAYPKVAAACRFVRATHKVAAIGSLDDAAQLLAGKAGTTIYDASL